MARIFVSYASEDLRLQLKLVQDLLNLGGDRNQIYVDPDPKSVQSSKDIDDALVTSDMFLIVMSHNYLDSNYCLDILRRKISNSGKLHKVIALLFEMEQQKEIPPLGKSGQILAMFDEEIYTAGIRTILNICLHLDAEKREFAADATRLLSLASGPNPFRYNAAEEIQDPDLFIELFHAPQDYERLVAARPTIIVGGRGTGKTMLLKSLELRHQSRIYGPEELNKLALAYLGIYWKAEPGALLGMSDQAALDLFREQVRFAIALDDFVYQMIILLLSELVELKKEGTIVQINASSEHNICEAIFSELFPEKSFSNADSTFLSATRIIVLEWDNLRNSVISLEVNQAGFHFRTRPGSLSNIFDSIRQIIQELKIANLYLLVDEYENLREFQQKVINSIAKQRSSIKLKIASKISGFTTDTLNPGQMLQEGHDYSLINLDYNLSDPMERDKYRGLVVGVAERTLNSDGYAHIEIQKILDLKIQEPKRKMSDPDPLAVTNLALEKELDKLLATRGFSPMDTENSFQTEMTIGTVTPRIPQESNQNLSKAKREALRMEYGKTLECRASIRQRNRILYSGFETILFLSGGTIRYFLELCGMMFHGRQSSLGKSGSIDRKTFDGFEKEEQTDACEIVSFSYMDRITQNTGYHAEILRQFIQDLGDIFRFRLLNDLSEPETFSISVVDSENLEANENLKLNEILNIAVRESIFQKIRLSEAMRPKDPGERRPVQYVLHRIYAPAFGTWYTDRWRTLVSCSDLSGLLSPKYRESALLSMKNKRHFQGNKDLTSFTK
jgi:hypothetical protein